MPTSCQSQYCLFPEIRWRVDVKTASKNWFDRGIDLQKDTYQLEYATDPTNQHAHYDEYYWIGLYFTTWDAHLSLFNPSNNFENPKYPPPNFDPDDQEANALKCPSDFKFTQ
ncbi:MAG: hypothetical protein WAN58_16740 [Anaerolineales bacterium]